MRFAARLRRAPIWGLLWLCMGPTSACEEELTTDENGDTDEEESGSSSGGGGSHHGSSSSASTRLEKVAECKSECDDDGAYCKKRCEEDDEDCNKQCDDARYDCRKSCDSDYCANTCDEDCEDDCEDADCSTPCDDECADKCDDKCKDGCKDDCAGKCDDKCKDGCKDDEDSCATTCTTKCHKSCGDDDDECKDGCHDDCMHSCGGGSSDHSPSGDNSSDHGSSGDSSGDHGSSGTDSKMSVTIKFEARVGRADFECGQEYPQIGSKQTTVTPTDMRMFVQDLALTTADGKDVPVQLEVRAPWQSDDVALLDFENGKGECGEGNAAVNTEITGTVPEDTYVGVSFTTGVPEEINHIDPTTAAAPISTYANLSWGWTTGFRFTKIELKEVTAKAGDPFGVGMLHIGSTACSGNAQAKTISCSKPNRNKIKLDKFNPKSSVVVIDIEHAFAKTDLSSTAECHSTSDVCPSMFEAFGIDYTSGKPTDSQTVFRVH